MDTSLFTSLAGAVLLSAALFGSICEASQWLTVTNAGLEEIPEIPAHTTDINLMNNNIGCIFPGSFTGCNSCLTLNLKQNRIGFLFSDILQGLSVLETLNLDSNPLSIIYAGTFSQLHRLMSLSLKNTELGEIRADMFEGLDNLRELTLRNSSLSELSPGTFSTMPDLLYLDLSFNSLSHFTGGVWEGIPELQYLKLSVNNIKTLGSFRGLEKLGSLELDFNPLRRVTPNMWEGLTSLKALNLLNCSISSVAPNSFANMPRLALYLDMNELKTLHRSIFGTAQPEFVSLHLGKNPLECDSRLCWIMEAEQEGWMSFSQDYGLRCSSPTGTQWSDLEEACREW